MNKVMVTGLAVGKDVGICQVCNFDIEWLLRYPSVLLWADKIIVPKAIWESAVSSEFPSEKKHPELNKCVKLIFEMANGEGIVDVIDPKETINDDIMESISEQAEKDRENLAELFPESVTLGGEKKVPGQMFIHGTEYCLPHIYTIYVNLILARNNDAHCLFSDSELAFCKYKFGLSGIEKGGTKGKIEGFNSVFNAYMPNDSILPEYVTVKKELCAKCAKEDKCKDGYLRDVENNFKKLIKLRGYDEIQQIKEVTNKIVNKRTESGGVLNSNEVLNDFREEQEKLRRRVRLVFPKVNRWANVTTILSIPVAFAGLATSSPLFLVTGAGLAGISQGTKQVIEMLSNKYSWIGFTNKDINLG